jgi:hypothetical protein
MDDQFFSVFSVVASFPSFIPFRLRMDGPLSDRDVSVVHHPVADRVCECGVGECLVPLFGGQLTGDHGGALVVTVFEDFQQVAPLGVLERRDEKVVEDKHMHRREASQEFHVAAVGPRDSQLVQQTRHARKERTKAVATCRLRECGTDIALADASEPDDDDVLLRAHPLARREAAHDGLVEPSFRARTTHPPGTRFVRAWPA